MQDMSSHADKDGLIRWIQAIVKPAPSQVFIVHGDDEVAAGFADVLTKEYGIPADAPFSGSVYDLVEGKWLKKTEGIPVEREAEDLRMENGNYVRLVNSLDRLQALIRNSSGYPNADLQKFAEQIDALCEKWTR